MKSGKGRSKDSFRDVQKTARNKPHSAPANQALGTKEHVMLPALHTPQLSLQPGGEFWTWFGVQPQRDSCLISLC